MEHSLEQAKGNIQTGSSTSALDQWGISVAMTLAVLAAFLLPLPQHGTIANMPSVCLFHNLTGLPCPGCGLTRSVVYFAHGYWAESVYYHPLGPLFFAVMLNLALAPILRKVWPRYFAALPTQVFSSSSLLASYALAGVFLLLWAARLSGLLPSPP